MKVVCLLMLLAAATVLKAPAGEPGGATRQGTAATGDPYLNDEVQSRGWQEYPGAIAGGWQLTLRLPTNEFRLGRSIAAKVVYRNVSTNQLRLYVVFPGLPDMFLTHVFDSAKKELRLTHEAHDQIQDRQPLMSKFRMVAPGMRLAFPLQVDCLYDFEAPRAYDLHVTAQGPLLSDTGLSTGAARIRIVPENPPTESSATTNHLTPLDKH